MPNARVAAYLGMADLEAVEILLEDRRCQTLQQRPSSTGSCEWDARGPGAGGGGCVHCSGERSSTNLCVVSLGQQLSKYFCRHSCIYII